MVVNDPALAESAPPQQLAELPPRSRFRRSREALREIATVVAGILIAFSLDAWWDARQERSATIREIGALRDEFHLNRDMIDRAQVRHGNISARLRALRRTLEEAQPGAQLQVHDSILGAVFEWRTTGWSTGTVQGLLASGRLERIGGPELRRLIADWPARVEEVNEDQLLARDFIQAAVIPEMPAHADVAHLVEPWPKRSDGSTVLRVNEKVKALVAARVAQEELITRSLRTFRNQVDTVLEHLNSQIEKP